MNTHTSQWSVDGVLEALSNVQRRQLLDSLIADSPPDDAARAGVAVDAGVEMHHVHLPKLDDAGLVNWDREANRVTRGPNFEDGRAVLESLAEHDRELPTSEVSR